MSDYRRYFVPGGTFYLTVVAYARRPIMTTTHGRAFLRNAIASVRKRHPFSLVANVLLPDHWHLIMQLPPGDDRYSLRMKQIKSEFTEQWLEVGLPEADVTKSERKRGETGIWQPRFWEHTVRGDEDLERCARDFCLPCEFISDGAKPLGSDLCRGGTRCPIGNSFKVRSHEYHTPNSSIGRKQIRR